MLVFASITLHLPRDYTVLVTIIGAAKQTQTVDEALPSLLQTELQKNADA